VDTECCKIYKTEMFSVSSWKFLCCRQSGLHVL